MFENNNEEKIHSFEKTQEQDKGVNKTRRSKNDWSGYVENGEKPSLKLLQLRRRHGHTAGGAVTSGKKDAGKNTNGGEGDEHCSTCIWKQLQTLYNSSDDINGEK